MPGISYPATTSSYSNSPADGGSSYDPDVDVPPSHTIYIIGGAVLIAAAGAYFLLRKKGK
jgi:LPXTG-motif cell wall-anchored protein